MTAVRHLVLFRFHDSVDQETRTNALESVRALRELPGILEWRLEVSTDDRKGVVVAQNVLFDSESAFQRYRQDPRHRRAGEVLAELADWLVADYAE